MPHLRRWYLYILGLPVCWLSVTGAADTVRGCVAGLGCRCVQVCVGAIGLTYVATKPCSCCMMCITLRRV